MLSIMKIEEIQESRKSKNPYDSRDLIFSGYLIELCEETIKIMVQDLGGNYCCEKVGFICSEDDLSSFTYAEFIKMEIVDTALNVTEAKFNKLVPDISEVGVEGVECISDVEAMFVNIETSKGTIQFTIYNTNGMYGHDVIIERTYSV